MGILSVLRILHLGYGPGINTRWHLLRGWLYTRPNWFQQSIFGIYRIATIEEREFIIITQDDRLGRTGILTETTEYTPKHVDLICAGVAITGRKTLRVGVFRCLNKDGICWAGRRTEGAADAFL
jgi:hypothetical protein